MYMCDTCYIVSLQVCLHIRTQPLNEMAVAIWQRSRFECPVEAMIISFLNFFPHPAFLRYFNLVVTGAANLLSQTYVDEILHGLTTQFCVLRTEV